MESKGNKYLQEFLNGDAPKIEMGFVNELKEVSETYDHRFKTFKALTTFRKCTRAGKTELAKKIMVKYGLDKLSPLRDDMTMALAMSLRANKK